jgi:hypothetical protein
MINCSQDKTQYLTLLAKVQKQRKYVITDTNALFNLDKLDLDWEFIDFQILDFYVLRPEIAPITLL